MGKRKRRQQSGPITNPEFQVEGKLGWQSCLKWRTKFKTWEVLYKNLHVWLLLKSCNIDIILNLHLRDKETEAWNLQLTWGHNVSQRPNWNLNPGRLVLESVLFNYHGILPLRWSLCSVALLSISPSTPGPSHTLLCLPWDNLPSTRRKISIFYQLKSFHQLKCLIFLSTEKSPPWKALLWANWEDPFLKIFSITDICAFFIELITVSNLFLFVTSFCLCPPLDYQLHKGKHHLCDLSRAPHVDFQQVIVGWMDGWRHEQPHI